jgi:hypothetical protein
MSARTRRSDVDGLGMGKLIGVKFLALKPERPEDQEDFALGVQPRMSVGAGLAQGSLIKVPEGTGAAFGSLEEGAIADGLQDAVALAIELFKAQRFVVTGKKLEVFLEKRDCGYEVWTSQYASLFSGP